MMGQDMSVLESEAKFFKVLSHPARLEILDVLRDGEQCVCHLETILGYRQSYISQHLTILRSAGIVEDRRDGWNIFYRVVQPRLYEVVDAAIELFEKNKTKAHRPVRVNKPSAACPCPKCSQNHDPLEHSDEGLETVDG
jgi:DNA-binding transcriptional ArsR family regulator